MDTNFYPFPLPIIPVMDWANKEIIRIDELATGGKDDPLQSKTHSEGVLDHCASGEYVPELLEGSLRQDLKALNVMQPDGPSFTVQDEQLIEWQKWRFRVSFNPREGAVIHDVNYDGRSILYRLSFSEMVRLQAICAGCTARLTPADCSICGPKITIPSQASFRLWRRWAWPLCQQPAARV